MAELPRWLIDLVYLVAAALFVLGLKGLTRPQTAVRGNLLGALAMLLAVVVTLLDRNILGYKLIVVGLAVGAIVGLTLAMKIQMTAMPQLVALLNGFGGSASALVAGAALIETALPDIEHPAGPTVLAIASVVSGLVGGVTFSGSLLAFAKLQELISGNPLLFSGQQIINAMLGLVALAVAVGVIANPTSFALYVLLLLVALILGVLLVIPIGGADMPVVIALLNSYSGLAASATGFVLNNNVLIIAGSLVGASGIILTRIMCQAMNRSLFNVLFGVLDAGGASSGAGDDVYAGRVKSTSPEEVALLLEGARRVAIVPGYGLAVSQAQHAVRDLADLLDARGTEVVFAIHPVAGRMPGHMNVLLAEANIPYDQLIEMDEVNPTFERTDVTLVIGPTTWSI